MDSVPTFCRHVGVCGGCSAPHVAHALQIEAKEAVLRKTLRPLLGATSAIDGRYAVPVSSLRAGPEDAEPRAFRQKVAFAFGAAPGGRGLVMGHYERGSQRVVPVTECPVHSHRGNQIAFALRDHLVRAGLGAAGPGRLSVLRHLLVRTTADDREAVAMLVVSRNEKALKAPVRAFLETADRPDGFFLNIHPKPGPFMVGPESVRIDGQSQVRERIGSLSFLISPTAFFQTNVAAASELQRTVHQAVGPTERILDLYCGSGLFSLPLAADGRHVIAVEENRQAIHDAEANRRINRIPSGRLRFVAGRVEQAIASVGRERCDAVILDPPRQGCSPHVLDAVFRRLAPSRVVYVSCNLSAFAGELPGILGAGYRVARVQAVDMFPHTDHIETVVTFQRT
jgi:23S rRNA (uracil1939-C5)-methyltransferase